MKKTILTILITAIICIVGTASAAYVYTARDIGYQSSDESWSVNNVQEAISELKTDVNNINNKVEGIERIYKAGEVELVALVSDDSFYTDINGKYVLSNSDTGRALLADTSTYKSLPSTDDCLGTFEVDTVTSVSKDVGTIYAMYVREGKGYSLTVIKDGIVNIYQPTSSFEDENIIWADCRTIKAKKTAYFEYKNGQYSGYSDNYINSENMTTAQFTANSVISNGSGKTNYLSIVKYLHD